MALRLGRFAVARATMFVAATLACSCGEEPDPTATCSPSQWDDTPFGSEVVAFSPGAGAGFGQDALPCVVLGPPSGKGRDEQSLDVLSLGVEGEVTLALGLDALDGPGPDLLVFENVFLLAGGDVPFAEPGEVSVSADGVDFSTFPCDPTAPLEVSGCAGLRPVFARGDDGAIDPTDPEQAGGDAFDLSDVGLERARYVRIRDVGVSRGGTDNRGFDLDAIAAVR